MTKLPKSFYLLKKNIVDNLSANERVFLIGKPESEFRIYWYNILSLRKDGKLKWYDNDLFLNIIKSPNFHRLFFKIKFGSTKQDFAADQYIERIKVPKNLNLSDVISLFVKNHDKKDMIVYSSCIQSYSDYMKDRGEIVLS